MTSESSFLEEPLDRGQLARILEGRERDEDLFEAAHSKLLREIGRGVYLRGLVEISNICRKNCFYCGLRRDNSAVRRYSMTSEEIVRTLLDGYRLGLRSFLLQSGELLGREHIEMVEAVLRVCSKEMPGARMVLSLGELKESDFHRLQRAGAHRYLIRIETSSPVLYRRYHPDDGLHSHADRLRTLEYLRDSGWQTGTGVLIGLPGQCPGDLAEDLLFMKRMDMDMIGMGPYIESPGTPMAGDTGVPSSSERILLTLRMIALARLAIEGVNIAATTALQTLGDKCLERGLMAGANVVMPNLTPALYREDYNLYSGKVLVGDTPEEMIDMLRERCGVVGRELVMEDPGDPPHYASRMGRQGGWE